MNRQPDKQPDRSKRMKAYHVPLKGVVTRDFVVYARSAAEAREKMLGDRNPDECRPMDDHYDEVGVGRARRMPTEDKYA